MALRKCIYFNSLALFIAFVLFLVPLLPPPGTAPSYLTFCLVKVVARRAVLAYFSLLFWFTLAVWFHLPSTKVLTDKVMCYLVMKVDNVAAEKPLIRS